MIEGNKKKLNLKLLRFEFVNLLSSIFVIIFGVIFPIFMTLIVAFGMLKNADTATHTGLFLRMGFSIPLATVFNGHASNFSTELGSGSHLRFKLFGYTEMAIIKAKLISQLIFLTASFVLYLTIIGIILDVAVPEFGALLIFIVFFICFLQFYLF